MHACRLALAWVGLWTAVVAADSPDRGSGSGVLVAFHSSHCGPCRRMEPVLDRLVAAGTPIRRVDVSRERSLADRHAVEQTPTYIIMRGGRETLRLVGVQSPDRLRAALRPPTTRVRETGASGRMTSRVSMPPVASVSTRDAIEAMPSLRRADAIERARSATVRLRVHDGHGYGVGTGTIIDIHGDEALVLTCGHLFRGNPRGRIEVDVFAGGDTKTVTGQLIDFDAKHRDIALVAIRPGVPMQPVLVAAQRSVEVGTTAFSFGCDRGKDPSRRDTRIIGVDKFNQQHNASNYEIDGAPIDGRSGGGLFDSAGRLIGVCNAADYDGDTGIYAGPGEIRWQLDRVNLARLYRQTESEPAVARTVPRTSTRPRRATAADAAPADGSSESPDEELIVIVRSKDGGPDRVVNIRQPSPALMAEIARRP